MTVPIEAIAALTGQAEISPPVASLAPAANSLTAGSFGQMLLGGVQDVDHKLADADATARAFALDDSIPLHQVTFALEQARLSFELMLQVRARLVEGYQEIMRMQL